MSMNNKEAAISDIARHSLNCIEKVAADAESARASHRRSGASAFANINTLNSPQQVSSLGKISDTEIEALSALIEQPVIARIHFIDENDEEDTIFAKIRFLQRAQVLVDEATDFSRVQLASMYELANPTMSSLFLCGDINQRLTSWGLKSNEALDWIGPGIQRKSITVSYRQSQRLVDLAKQVATLGGSQVNDIILPDRLDVEGVAPVWKTQLTNNAEKAEWLTQRIHEIDRMVQKATTIAVLVNEEEHVEELALELNDRLEEISLSAVACKDGKVVGNDRDVRVFDIRHIKGLEFEAVFFMDLDKTITQHPELFSKYLYVGATRAASYLGVTFGGDVPPPVASLRRYFGQDWSLQSSELPREGQSQG